jgi:hypothetical protein
VKHIVLGAIAFGSLVWLGGCATQGEAVPINVGLKPPAAPVEGASSGAVSVAVTPFEDDRSDRTKLGIRHSFWGTDEPYSVKNGTVGEATAKALVDYLSRQGWRVQLAPLGSRPEGADVVISGKVLELTANAHGVLGSTDIRANNKVLIQASNRRDGSSITDTISHTGAYTVFWYAPQDGEEILSDLLERNFEKFVSQTKFDGPSLRFR